jgi:hypothetical protein
VISVLRARRVDALQVRLHVSSFAELHNRVGLSQLTQA